MTEKLDEAENWALGIIRQGMPYDKEMAAALLAENERLRNIESLVLTCLEESTSDAEGAWDRFDAALKDLMRTLAVD